MQEVEFKALKGVNSVIVNSIERLKYMHEFLLEFKPRVGFGIERLCVVKLIAKLMALSTRRLLLLLPSVKQRGCCWHLPQHMT